MMQAYDPNGPGSKMRRHFARLVSRRPARRALDRPMVSFSFDDVPLSGALNGAAVLEERGLRGTFYVCAGLAGEPSAHLGDMAGADEIRTLARAGHEIGCHTHSHPNCGTLPPAAFAEELERNTSVLRRWGVAPPTTFAYPYGEVAHPAKRVAARRFALSRSVRPGLVRKGGDLAQAPSVGLQGPEGEELALEWLERARASNAWLILFTHDVRADASVWGTTSESLARVVDAAVRDGVEVVTVAAGARRLGALQ